MPGTVTVQDARDLARFTAQLAVIREQQAHALAVMREQQARAAEVAKLVNRIRELESGLRELILERPGSVMAAAALLTWKKAS